VAIAILVQSSNPSSDSSPIAALIFFVLIVTLYFLPSIVAASRKKQNTTAIFAVNFFLGWTFLGWVVALVWALTADPAPPTQQFVSVAVHPGVGSALPQTSAFFTCSSCGRNYQAVGIFCPYCGAAKRPQISE
jgi:RsiW-degrading membrane proteinase PrsW (M82 family)